jgi:hypothetical protein
MENDKEIRRMENHVNFFSPFYLKLHFQIPYLVAGCQSMIYAADKKHLVLDILKILQSELSKR